MKYSTRPPGRYTDLRIIQLRNSVVKKEGKRQLLGFESWIKNFGNGNAPGELAGCLDVLYTLHHPSSKKPVACGIKTPVFLATSEKTRDTSFCEEDYRFPFTKNITSTLPGGIDIYPPGTNAQMDIAKVPDGIYLYGQHLDPNGTYFFQEDIPHPYEMLIQIKTKKKQRIVCRKNESPKIS